MRGFAIARCEAFWAKSSGAERVAGIDIRVLRAALYQPQGRSAESSSTRTVPKRNGD